MKAQKPGIKSLGDNKLWGFIERGSGEKDLFLHFSAIQKEGFKTVRQGDKVEFKIIKTEKGDQAADVVVLETKARDTEPEA